jgi:hypothetical protein
MDVHTVVGAVPMERNEPGGPAIDVPADRTEAA